LDVAVDGAGVGVVAAGGGSGVGDTVDDVPIFFEYLFSGLEYFGTDGANGADVVLVAGACAGTPGANAGVDTMVA